MLVKQAGKIILGAELTPREMKALEIEIRKLGAEEARKHADEVDAIMLWWLHEKRGHGYKILKEFHHDFATEYFALCDRYEMETEEDRIWLCSKKLIDYDPRIDIHAWNKEIMEEVRKKRGLG